MSDLYGSKYSDNDFLENAEFVHVVFDWKCLKIIRCDEFDSALTFRDVLETAKTAGYKTGVLLVIAESPLHGTVYKCGNHGGLWEKVGETMGFA